MKYLLSETQCLAGGTTKVLKAMTFNTREQAVEAAVFAIREDLGDAFGDSSTFDVKNAEEHEQFVRKCLKNEGIPRYSYADVTWEISQCEEGMKRFDVRLYARIDRIVSVNASSKDMAIAMAKRIAIGSLPDLGNDSSDWFFLDGMALDRNVDYIDIDYVTEIEEGGRL